MANKTAFEAGWDTGPEEKKKKKDDQSDSKKDKKSGGKQGGGSGGVYSGIGGMGIMPILNQILSSGSAMPQKHSARRKRDDDNSIKEYKKGGPVKRTGLALLHKGEFVVPAKHRSTKKASRKRTITKH